MKKPSFLLECVGVGMSNAFLRQGRLSFNLTDKLSEPTIAVHGANPAWLLGWKNLDALSFGS